MNSSKDETALINDYEIKNKDYFQGINKHILRLIDPNVDSVLEIGCAEGDLGLAIKKTTGSYVVGIEYFANAAKEAERKLDYVINGDIETINLPFEKKSFDHIIFGDVLEHLKNPWGVLEKVRPYLKDSGSILTSIPNVGHISIIESLLSENWTYQNSGLLDKTHFRFFTLREIIKMFISLQYNITNIESIPVTNQRYEQFISVLDDVRQTFNIGNQQFKDEARSYQYVVKAELNLD